VLRALDRRLRAAFRERFVGRTLSVLFETSRDRATRMLRGYSDNYVPVLCEARDTWRNRVARVTALHTAAGGVVAELSTRPAWGSDAAGA
jgi:tRNA A37 methylthiotransferase MiaB